MPAFVNNLVFLHGSMLAATMATAMVVLRLLVHPCSAVQVQFSVLGRLIFSRSLAGVRRSHPLHRRCSGPRGGPQVPIGSLRPKQQHLRKLN